MNKFVILLVVMSLTMSLVSSQSQSAQPASQTVVLQPSSQTAQAQQSFIAATQVQQQPVASRAK